MEAMVNVKGRRLRGKVVSPLSADGKTILIKIQGPDGERIIKRHLIKHRVVFEGYQVWKEEK